MQLRLQHIDHVAIAVSDLDDATTWYQEVLGLERRLAEVWDEPRMLCAGETCVALFAAEGHPKPPPGRDTIAMRHLAFRTDREGFEAAQRELGARGIEFEFEDHGIWHSIYLHDPDGHGVEVTTYELEEHPIRRG